MEKIKIIRVRRRERIVYVAINKVNGKRYIGCCVSFKERIARHLRSAEIGVDTRFYRAIRKYGKENFEWKILRENISSIKACRKIEKEMIKKYDTYNIGYNATWGGDGGYTGKNSGQFKKGFTPWSKGKKLSYSHVKKLKEADRSKSYRPVLQYTLDGKFVKEWGSCKEVFEKYNFLVNSVASNKYYNKSAQGYMWKYKNGCIPKKIPARTVKKHTRKGRIMQLTLKGKRVRIWKSAYAVIKMKGWSSIYHCLYGYAKTSHKYKWKYYEK